MPLTSAGTAYTVHTATLPTHGECVWAVADAHANDADIPTILYAHGSQGAANQFATLSAWAGMRDWLIDNGWAWIEGSGGAVSGAYNWGNAEARAAYPAYVEHVSGILDLGPVVLLGRSMGGLVTAWLCAMSGLDYAGWINNSGVTTMFVGESTTAAAAADRNTGFYFGTPIRDAYGVSTYAQLVAAAADHAPEAWDPSVWAGRKILNLYGDADVTVPWVNRGAGPMRDIWAGQPAIDEVYVRPGGDHSGSNGSYLDVTPMANFLVTITGGDVEPEPPPTYDLILGRYLLGPNGERYEISPRPMEVPET